MEGTKRRARNTPLLFYVHFILKFVFRAREKTELITELLMRMKKDVLCKPTICSLERTAI